VFVASRTDDQPGEYGRRGGGGALFLTVAPASGDPWHVSGPVATVDLAYRLPGSDQLLHQEVAVSSQASAGDEEPWLSAESMAEHYAMLSVYLGLRQATRDAEGSYSCAKTALARLDERAARWVEETGDQDVEADRALIAQFIDNLEAVGGVAIDGDYSAQCWGGGEGYPNDDVIYDDQQVYACSAAGGRGGWLGLVALGLVYLRRRRS
jgi:MYXO-CTERM domain-containing protein